MDQAEWMNLVESWLTTKTKIKAASKELYRTCMRRWHTWCVEHELDPLAAGHQEAVLFLREVERRTSASTQKNQHTALNGMYGWLIKQRLADVNPVADVSRGEQLQRSIPVLRLPDFQHIWFACTEDFERVAFGLNAFGPLRAEEICSVKLEDITTREGRPILRLRLRSRKATYASDWMALPPPLHEAIIRHAAGRNRGPILLNSRGRPYTGNSLWRLYNRMGIKAQLPVPLTTEAVFDAWRLIAIQQSFPFGTLIRSAGETRTDTMQAYMSMVPQRYGDHASLRMASLVVGYPSQTHRLAADAERLLHEDKMLPLAAGALAGAALERHLRLLCRMHNLGADEDRAKMTTYADALFKAGNINRNEFHDIQGAAAWRDDASHGWEDRHDHKDADSLVTLLKRIADDYPIEPVDPATGP